MGIAPHSVIGHRFDPKSGTKSRLRPYRRNYDLNRRLDRIDEVDYVDRGVILLKSSDILYWNHGKETLNFSKWDPIATVSRKVNFLTVAPSDVLEKW